MSDKTYHPGCGGRVWAMMLRNGRLVWVCEKCRREFPNPPLDPKLTGAH